MLLNYENKQTTNLLLGNLVTKLVIEHDYVCQGSKHQVQSMKDVLSEQIYGFISGKYQLFISKLGQEMRKTFTQAWFPSGKAQIKL